jgi:hypothetical protein
VDHLCGHATNGRDIFVTDDKGILKRTDGLAAIGIKVCNPTECIDYLDRLETSRRTQQLVAVKSDPRYASIRLAGSASFDYSNNNGMFTIGEGIFLFETKWSKASTGSIHAYSGTQSVAAIALDKTTKQIADLRNVGSLDYSSRSRTARAGQIVVLKNRNNFYAALKVNHVHDDRYQREDELNFDYKIFSEGAP